MPQINELANEIVSTIEIYFYGRGQQLYNNATFILCDDYTELASKLYLIKHNAEWRDVDAERMDDYLAAKASVEAAAQAPNAINPLILRIFQRGEPRGRFKNYHKVLQEVSELFTNQPTTHPALEVVLLDRLQTAMKVRRDSRNNLVHTSGPLGMQISSGNCIEALCDLIDYVEVLFQSDWRVACSGARRMETYKLLLLLERHVQRDTAARVKIDKIFQERRRQDTTSHSKGVEALSHGHDLFVPLCIWLDSDHALKAKLQVLYDTLPRIM